MVQHPSVVVRYGAAPLVEREAGKRDAVVAHGPEHEVYRQFLDLVRRHGLEPTAPIRLEPVADEPQPTHAPRVVSQDLDG